MRRAVELSQLCVAESRPDVPPKVGAVAVTANGALLGEAHRGARAPGDHAEYCIIAQLGENSGALAGATVYTTLEPCTERSPDKIPCAQRLIDEGVAIVYVGLLDPDPRIRELGWSKLGAAGIERRDFTAELREELRAINAQFIDRFRLGVGPSGTITFDYMQNSGRMTITSESATFDTNWNMAGKGSIYGKSRDGGIALSKTAGEFDEIDDPGLFDFVGHTKHAREGQIIIFKNDLGYALVRVESVLAGPDRGDPYTAATVSWELRLHG
jgi:diaminohydroxyphosphoribosylaminopyrimidine deaminase/5-amino-6-(5-phosphoribosylamino)uracil reductase